MIKEKMTESEKRMRKNRRQRDRYHNDPEFRERKKNQSLDYSRQKANEKLFIATMQLLGAVGKIGEKVQ